MKNTMKTLRYAFTTLCICLFTGICAYAQTDTLTSADYHVQMPKHLNPFYNGPLSYIIFGVVLVFLGSIIYRYWVDNYSHTTVDHHEPHHQ